MQLRYLLPIFMIACLFGSVPGQALAQTVPTVPVPDQAAALEERLIDLQVQIATVRSLARSAAPVATSAAPQQPFRAVLSDAGSGQQIATLESEIRSLSGQIKQLTGTAPLILPAATRAQVPVADQRAPMQPQIQPQIQSQGQSLPGQPGVQQVPGNSAGGGWAGSTTVTPGRAVPGAVQPGAVQPGAVQPGTASSAGEILPGTVYPGYKPAGPQQSTQTGNVIAAAPRPLAPAGSAAATGSANAETAYQTAYGYLLQQDYGAAQVAFKEFIERYPTTPLAGNAQYWLGETHYVRGAYKNAAVAFLKGYEKYGDGNKGADSLLKLGMSLGKLRQTAAACSSLRELGKRYRNAPETTLARAKAEIGRMRCPR